MDARCSCPASPTPGRCRSRVASTCSRRACARPIGIKVCGADLEEIETHRARRPGGAAAQGARHPQRLRRAGGGRLLPRLRAEARPARPLRPVRRRTPTDGDDGRRRRRPAAPPSRGASATGQRALPARLARRPARARAACCLPPPERRADADGGDRRRRSSCSGPSMIRDENGLLAGYVYVDFEPRRRHRRLRRRRPSGRCGGHVVPPGYSLPWSGQYENMLRVQRAAEDHGADHACCSSSSSST